MEIGKTAADQTKEFKDAYIKMPHVTMDMLSWYFKQIPIIVHKAHITGFSINGAIIRMLDVDSPKGYITRVRRTQPLPYPSSEDDYVIRMKPLLQLAATALAKMESTLHTYKNTEIPLTSSNSRRVILPPCFHPISTATSATSTSKSSRLSSTVSPSSCSSSSPEASSSKRQKKKQ